MFFWRFRLLWVQLTCFNASYIYIYIYIPTPLQEDEVIQGHFKWSLTSLNSVFLSPRQVAIPSLSYYLASAGERKVGFIPFPKVLTLSPRI